MGKIFGCGVYVVSNRDIHTNTKKVLPTLAYFLSAHHIVAMGVDQ